MPKVHRHIIWRFPRACLSSSVWMQPYHFYLCERIQLQFKWSFGLIKSAVIRVNRLTKFFMSISFYSMGYRDPQKVKI